MAYKLFKIHNWDLTELRYQPYTNLTLFGLVLAMLNCKYEKLANHENSSYDSELEMFTDFVEYIITNVKFGNEARVFECILQSNASQIILNFNNDVETV